MGTVGLEALNVGGWLTHGNFALETSADFLAVSEHRLIPAGGRGFTLSGPPGGSHVGHAGIGIVSLRGAIVAMPTFAIAAFRKYFDLRRLVRGVLPFGNGRLMHLVVAYGFQGADDDAQKLLSYE